MKYIITLLVILSCSSAYAGGNSANANAIANGISSGFTQGFGDSDSIQQEQNRHLLQEILRQQEIANAQSQEQQRQMQIQQNQQQNQMYLNNAAQQNQLYLNNAIQNATHR